MKQVHSGKVYRLTDSDSGSELLIDSCDGIYTGGREKTALGIRLADCMGVLSYYRGRCIGGFHAGWRGCRAGIGENFVSVAAKDGLKPEFMEFRISPHICRSCCRVSNDFNELFPQAPVKRGRLNLFKCIVRQLSRCGVLPQKIKKPGGDNPCTLENKSYFSHRRGDKERMLMFAIQS